VIIPKAVHKRQGWQPGTELEVEERDGLVVPRRAPLFPPTTIDEVYPCLNYDGIAETVRQMWEEFERQGS
jgi:bifunctional DNA-binding transcriptional regulator/antitoxin component of YhaV-PrlF toxin-antitoxin module